MNKVISKIEKQYSFHKSVIGLNVGALSTKHISNLKLGNPEYGSLKNLASKEVDN